MSKSSNHQKRPRPPDRSNGKQAPAAPQSSASFSSKIPSPRRAAFSLRAAPPTIKIPKKSAAVNALIEQLMIVCEA